ncbi:hypothetical protein FOZ62_006756, partial [Perkinsus olseni]
ANYRCHKLTSSGGTRCRSTKNPIAGDYWFEPVDGKHSTAAADILIRCGLASLDHQGRLNLGKELSRGKYRYPTVQNEHFTPTSDILFAVTRSNVNILIVDRTMSSQ